MSCISGIACPFCGESDFDLIGLKHHLLNYCERFERVQALPKPTCLETCQFLEYETARAEQAEDRARALEGKTERRHGEVA
jgi:hypothetical protein